MQYLMAFILTASAMLHAKESTSPSLRRSEGVIREWLLRENPKRSSMEEVIGTIERQGWTDYQIDRTNGFYDQRTKPAKVTGEKSIRAVLGEYRSIFYITNVTVFWGFDEEGRLVDVWVWKTTE